MRKSLPFGPYLPDQSPVGDLLTTAENVYSGTTGYLPVGSYIAQTNALPYAFGGGASFISTTGTVTLLAGTDGGIYSLNSPVWTSITTSTAGRWKFSQFANYVIALNGGTTKVVSLATGVATALAAAPSGTSLAVVGAFVIIGAAGGDRLKVQWSAFDDHTSWTPAVNQSGFQGMHDGGEVMGLAGGEYAVILQRFALTRMTLSGDSLQPFQFAQITSNFGCASKASVAQAGRTVFFLSDRGFIALDDGQAPRPIGNEKIDASFRATVSQGDYELLHVAVDPKRTLVFWGIPGTPGTIWCYNWVLDRWTTLKLSFAGFFFAYQAGVNLEALSALYPNLDTVPYSLDSPFWQGGDPRLYFVGPDLTVGALTGPSLAATLAYGTQDPFGERRMRLRAAWPITDATAGVTVTVSARQRMGDVSTPVVTTSMQASGRVPLRTSGRYAQITVSHAAGSAWTYTQGLELEAEPAGVR